MKRVVVIGAGAAGTMAAIFAASSGAETRLLERTNDGGRKILISGGGRCNILPAVVRESRFVTDSSPHTLRKMLRSWPLSEQIAFFKDEAGIPLMEEAESAKLFPQSERARDVRDRLLALARARGVVIETGALVTGLVPAGNGWQIERRGGSSLQADAVVVATGGLSFPGTGSDGLGLRIVKTLGHTITPTYPALTPLTATVRRKSDTTGGAPFAALSGISLQVTLTARAGTLESTSTGGFLFTHHGYSGPAVLDVSHVPVRSRAEMDAPARLVVRWTPLNDKDWESAFGSRGARTALNAVAAQLPRRLAEALIDFAGIDIRRTLSQLTRDERLRLIDILVRCELPWSGDEGYGKAEVTGGGVCLSEIDPKTMESKIHKGLFLCGEMLDAFGPIGGYNFLWAWATGRAAGLGASRT
ncbi:MAG: aminoacetone oxidase family FAD-binding enzyme [bacterium]|uniref:Aminoacetone oxidase family FAD-binding enzyme n=1 Tax=Candidatus Methylomirabilis tolerans TaxID=3123416 RepID=A0AAJ1EIN6_9BACT|nr:aminoacetone oxidase family FAD-binding enzyme [Candidatus Methylomirabilis sp.]